MRRFLPGAAACLLLLTPVIAPAQTAGGQAPAADPAAKAPDSLVLHFETGSADVRPEDMALLDKASRLYRDGKPIVMIVSGSTDRTGAGQTNLLLSQHRATNVVQGLVARGIPAERFQILAKGESGLAVETDPGVAEPENRRVEITWR